MCALSVSSRHHSTLCPFNSSLMDNLTPLLADTMALQACRRSRPRQCASARTNPDNPNRTCADPVAAQENALLVGLPPCFNSSSVQMQPLPPAQAPSTAGLSSLSRLGRQHALRLQSSFKTSIRPVLEWVSSTASLPVLSPQCIGLSSVPKLPSAASTTR